ncbi:hypothetical protein M433DRAFT_484432 [Acidomyces richmondensis BFW]|nr:MAG: hypothetical protein FE78DRAFT_280021 [Acidomyces sp. 'richmondensis']KYG47668.1 hypothetical protein M433DRAFT_484432 [Acidomyces richmondensis BFW]
MKLALILSAPFSTVALSTPGSNIIEAREPIQENEECISLFHGYSQASLKGQYTVSGLVLVPGSRVPKEIF